MRKRFHGLKRIKLRQSWNKYNLFNLSRIENPGTGNRTYFQQKWTAKAVSRAYHGETVREKHWQNMFRPNFNSVIPFDYEELAREDGSKYAKGRGSGLVSPGDRTRRYPKTPYMNMVYAPLERRLDTAVFRALFASSTRQARQFVVHGYVKVNGKTMIYPGYQLNPGDMFQVEPDRVLYATGVPKDARERRATRRLRARNSKPEDTETPESPTKNDREAPNSKDTSETSNTSKASETTPENPKETLSSLLTQAKAFLSNPPNGIHAKRKQDLRAFARLLKQNISKRTTLTDSLEAQFLELTAQFDTPSSPQRDVSNNTPGTETPETPEKQDAVPAALTAVDRIMLREALAEARENPIDPSKPYGTPWRPRQYIAPFIFVPRYLEVHHRICSAVYLRHPVARPGLGEVPTPFSSETNGLAFLWYLRRR